MSEECEPPATTTKLPWRSPKAPEGTRTLAQFIFVSADVIGHSEFIRAAKSDRAARALDDTLTALETWLKEELGADVTADLCWDWAGDGGLFGFLADQDGDRYATQVVERAISIWQGLEAFNDRQNCYKKHHDSTADIRLRIAVAKGTAYFSDNASRRRSHALNVVGKLKVPERFTTVSITADVRAEFESDLLRNAFRKLAVRILDEEIYGYVPAIQRGLAAGIAAYEGKHAVFAAYYWYRLFESHLLQGDVDGAKDALDAAIRGLDAADPRRIAPYYHRVLKAYGTGWRDLLDAGLAQQLKGRVTETDALHILREPATQALLKAKDDGTWPLLLHLRFLFDQLDILEREFVNVPTGFSSLDACQLLLHIGVPPTAAGRNIKTRLDRVARESQATSSIDGECTLCTGTALSGLALAGADARLLNRLVDWLAGKASGRFVHRLGPPAPTKPDQHGMHYAARVLDGFMDAARAGEGASAAKARQLWNDVASKFFPAVNIAAPNGTRSLLDEWLRHRMPAVWEMTSFILPAFLRWYLDINQAPSFDAAALAAVVKELKSKLDEECRSAGSDEKDTGSDEKVALAPYAVRQNLGGLCLGFVLDLGDVSVAVHTKNSALAFHSIALWHEPATPEPDSSELFDSRVDHFIRFVDGWLLYWETVLFLRDNETDVTALLPDWSRDGMTPATTP